MEDLKLYKNMEFLRDLVNELLIMFKDDPIAYGYTGHYERAVRLVAKRCEINESSVIMACDMVKMVGGTQKLPLRLGTEVAP